MLNTRIKKLIFFSSHFFSCATKLLIWQRNLNLRLCTNLGIFLNATHQPSSAAYIQSVAFFFDGRPRRLRFPSLALLLSFFAFSRFTLHRSLSRFRRLSVFTLQRWMCPSHAKHFRRCGLRWRQRDASCNRLQLDLREFSREFPFLCFHPRPRH